MTFFVGVLLLIGGFLWAALVLMACGMSSRPTTSADEAPALFGLAAMVLGLVFILTSVVKWIAA